MGAVTVGMSTDQPTMESAQSSEKSTPLELAVTIISCGGTENRPYAGWADQFREIEVIQYDGPQPEPTSESTDVVLVDAVDAEESLESVFDDFHIDDIDEPIGVITDTDAGAITSTKQDIELAVGPISDQEVVELVRRMRRRREYRLLLQQDFAVTHLLVTIQSVDGKLGNYQKYESLMERKERLRNSLRELQDDFDNADYQALFTAGFGAVA